MTELRRVLLVLPDKEANRILSGAVAGAGLNPVSAATMGQALKRLEQERIALVFTATALADGSFHGLLARMAEAHREIPVVVVSAVGEWDECMDAMRAGAFDCIAAPYFPEQVTWILANALPNLGIGAPRRSPVAIHPPRALRKAAV